MQNDGVSLAATAAVSLGSSHGYRFEQDRVHLNAELDVRAAVGSSDRYSMQLWACDVPYGGGRIQGTKVAEVPLPLSGGRQHLSFDAQTMAAAPAGPRDYAMVLVLAADGKVRDYANYGARERFEGPRLEGAVGYSVDGGEVTLHAERVGNSREAGNLSGSLVLELRARSLPDTRRDDVGLLLAQAQLERLHGQHELVGVERRVSFTPPRPGRWLLSLELREWCGDRYVTRDWVDFEVPFERVAELRAVPNVGPKASAPKASASKAIAPKATTPKATAPKATAPGVGVSKTPTERPVGRTMGKVSVSTATLQELAAVPGLNAKLAQEIVRARPFKSLDELVKVRGIGPRMLQKLRQALAL